MRESPFAELSVGFAPVRLSRNAHRYRPRPFLDQIDEAVDHLADIGASRKIDSFLPVFSPALTAGSEGLYDARLAEFCDLVLAITQLAQHLFRVRSRRRCYTARRGLGARQREQRAEL